jgi:hypothetical protein
VLERKQLPESAARNGNAHSARSFGCSLRSAIGPKKNLSAP